MICLECNGRGETTYYHVGKDSDTNALTFEERIEICRTCNGSGKMPMTNADRIRAMSDEELAEFITEKQCGWCTEIGREMYRQNNLHWLKQPVEDS